MTLQTIPDVDHIVGNHLALHDDIEAITGSGRVVAETPKNTDAPWIRLTQLDATSLGRHRSEHAIESYFQLDCYSSKVGYQGSQQRDAARLALAARAVLTALPEATLSGLVVTGVDIRSHGRSPDRDFEPSRQRYIITVLIWGHA